MRTKTDEALRFGQRLETLRKRKGLSRRTVAEKAGCYYRFVGQLERGEFGASWEMATRLADALGVKIEAFK